MPRYHVAGKHAVAGNAPGTDFDADFSAVEEERLVQSGAVTVNQSAEDGEDKE